MIAHADSTDKAHLRLVVLFLSRFAAEIASPPTGSEYLRGYAAGVALALRTIETHTGVTA